MAVSKRTRFEVLRRDDYTCRYCRSAENPLTIDHVVPTSLGGTDDPANLVTACRDCNAGKSSASPDAALVANVADDAVRWSAAMKKASDNAESNRQRERAALDAFRDHVWGAWEDNSGDAFPLPPDWEAAVLRQLKSDLRPNDVIEAVRKTMEKNLAKDARFRYFLGVCKHMLIQRVEAARVIIAEGGV